eukprot:CAMPEP_0204885448 /NCGR_PEP_ID=MMETSP1349-20130617/12666_1 /ASSEMBLY_ACC=CAM_ASM_000710 /TAXON_ID=215587 /ORGANISM="Aplanochytrium stocchinoi, Strain GSBS06" /LENGTH=359 /DNA_ID=CAMNT_0052046907 /DNA_START=299 /DNA_END=1378 /DNA_ORIENTATION=+
MAVDLFPQSPMFSNLGVSLLTLYEIAVGDDWNAIMHKLGEQYGVGGRVFITISYFLISLVTVNLFIWVMLASFEQEFVNKALGQSSLSRYRKKWNKTWRIWNRMLRKNMMKNLPGARGHKNKQTRDKINELIGDMVDINYMAPEMVPLLLSSLKPPLGIINFNEGSFTRREVLRVIHLARIPITKSGMVNYNALLFALSDFRYTVNNHEEIPDNLKHIALQLHLGKVGRKRYKQICEEGNPDYFLSHYMAARVIQQRFTRKYLKREEYAIRDALDIWTSMSNIKFNSLPSATFEDETKQMTKKDSVTSLFGDNEPGFYETQERSTILPVDNSDEDSSDSADSPYGAVTSAHDEMKISLV